MVFKGGIHKPRRLTMKQSCQKIRLEVTANDDFLQPIIEVIKIRKIRPISKNGRNVGNSKIFMLPLEDITRICTNENGLHTI